MWIRENFILPLGFKPLTFQPVASRYTDYIFPSSAKIVPRTQLLDFYKDTFYVKQTHTIHQNLKLYNIHCSKPNKHASVCYTTPVYLRQYSQLCYKI